LEDFYEHAKHSAGRVVMEVKNMSDGDRVKGANFQLRQGEALGLTIAGWPGDKFSADIVKLEKLITSHI
jgi:ABC-type sugar transport system ATPase subunit